MNPMPLMPADPFPTARAAEALAAVGAGGGKAASRRDEIIQAAKDFESVLLDRLLQEMKRTIPESGLLGGGAATRQMWDLFWGQLARDIASRGGLGLWKQLSRQFGADPVPSAAPAGAEAPSETKP
ncbi:MAG: rod-binding protein [Planctomycetota bacterium]|jgi:Rod binding domain-containing protein